MFAGRAPQRPQRILQPLRESHEAFSAKHHVGVLETGIGKPEVIEPMLERYPRNRNRSIVHDRKIRQAASARHMILPENDILLLAMDGAPCANPPLQCPANTFTQFRVTPDHFFEDSDGTDAWGCPQHRHDVGIKNIAEWVGTAPLPGRLLLRRQAWVLVDAVSRGRADRRPRRCNARRIGLGDVPVDVEIRSEVGVALLEP